MSTTSGILTVGDGRGFVVLHKRPGIEQRLVITAAHCLPEEPVAASFWDHTYASLLGPLNQNPTVRADCLFFDRIADIAVLGPPDDQKYFNDSLAYDRLLDSLSPFSVSRSPREGPARLYSLDGRWFPCTVKQWRDDSLDIFEASEGIKGGMSGSPIVVDDGSAIGVVCCSQGGSDEDDDRAGGPNPALTLVYRDGFCPACSGGQAFPLCAAKSPIATGWTYPLVPAPQLILVHDRQSPASRGERGFSAGLVSRVARGGPTARRV